MSERYGIEETSDTENIKTRNAVRHFGRLGQTRRSKRSVDGSEGRSKLLGKSAKYCNLIGWSRATEFIMLMGRST